MNTIQEIQERYIQEIQKVSNGGTLNDSILYDLGWTIGFTADETAEQVERYKRGEREKLISEIKFLSNENSRIISDPNLEVSLIYTSDTGETQFVVAVEKSSNTEGDIGYWLGQFETESEARAYIEKRGFIYDGKVCVALDFDHQQNDIRYSGYYDDFLADQNFKIKIEFDDEEEENKYVIKVADSSEQWRNADLWLAAFPTEEEAIRHIHTQDLEQYLVHSERVGQ
jgi:hypothetical protein